jgi:hypothetical protein
MIPSRATGDFMSPTTTALVVVTPISKAFQWIKMRLRRRPPSDLPRLVQVSVRLFLLSPGEAQWLIWTLDPHLVALASKEPASV